MFPASERARSKHEVRNNTCCRPIYSDTDSGMYANMARSPGLLRLNPFVQGKRGKLAIHIPHSAPSSVFEGDRWPRYPRYPPKWMSLAQHGTSRASGMVSKIGAERSQCNPTSIALNSRPLYTWVNSSASSGALNFSKAMDRFSSTSLPIRVFR